MSCFRSCQRPENAYDIPQLRYGVSLKHLASLPIDPNDQFYKVAEFIKSKTESLKGYRSYANYLRSTKATKHLVKRRANVFVSYAWAGQFGKTMEALTTHFAAKLDKIFVWMDVAIVDQHAASSTEIVFWQWKEVFTTSLTKIGRAVLVLTPGHEPLAVRRSWCCFEWVTIVKAKIKFDFCVPKDDSSALIQEMHAGMDFDSFNKLFSGINVAEAKAFKKADQINILGAMIDIGIIKVNDIVMNCLKTWLVKVAEEAMRATKDDANEMINAVSARAAISHAMVRYVFFSKESSLHCMTDERIHVCVY
jgi:hypothetical protein